MVELFKLVTNRWKDKFIACVEANSVDIKHWPILNSKHCPCGIWLKRAKQEKKFAAELKKGDRVITKSGLHGKIMDLNEKDGSCVIETMAGKLKFDRSAISMEMSKKLEELLCQIL